MRPSWRGHKTCLLVLTWIHISLLWSPTALAQAEVTEWLTIGGLLFGDAYHVPSHHLESGDGATGVVLRRGYLTFDADLSEKWFGRVRFEVNQSGEFETYDFEVDFKDLHGGRNFGRHRVLFGLAPTPTFDLIESIWGLRYLARTPMDLQGIPSRDTGVFARGPLNTEGTLAYRAMVGAGVEFGAESGNGARWMGALEWRPNPDWVVDFYVDFERLPGPRDRATIQLFAAHVTDNLRWGFQYSHQDREDDPTLELASAFVVRDLGEKTSLIARVDRIMQPSPEGNNIAYIPFDPTARATFFVGGVEIRATPHLTITPNTIVTVYDENDQGITPTTDWHLRLTFFLDFE